MVCPYCGAEMEEGGLVVNGIKPGLVPLEQFRKKGLKRLVYSGLQEIGTSNYLLGQAKIPNAFFCKNCKKIVGVFDIVNQNRD